MRPTRFRARLLLVLLFLLGAGLSACQFGLECFGVGGEECQRAANAARLAIPPGHRRLVVEAGPGEPTPYSVFACYPDGSQVVVEVRVMADGSTDVRPLEGIELASCGQ